MTHFPSIFISHGPPTIAVEGGPTHDFLRGLGSRLGRPEGVLCISAHWETERPAVSSASAPATIHDFFGFPEALYRLSYPAPGAPQLAERVATMLVTAELVCDLHPDRGLDHGAWIPLFLMYPNADVPVAQLSIQHHLGPAHHVAVGKALSELRSDGVLVLASGNITHNLSDMRTGVKGDTPSVDWAAAFDDWVADRSAAGDIDALANYRTLAPFAEQAHPRDEHYLPFLVAAGAGGDKGTGSRLHKCFMYGSLSMAAYAFGEGDAPI